MIRIKISFFGSIEYLNFDRVILLESFAIKGIFKLSLSKLRIIFSLFISERTPKMPYDTLMERVWTTELFEQIGMLVSSKAANLEEENQEDKSGTNTEQISMPDVEVTVKSSNKNLKYQIVLHK